MKFPFRNIVFDGGIVIELLLLGEDSELYTSILKGDIEPIATNLATIEAEYILCRRLGRKLAFNKVDNLVDSNFINIYPLDLICKEVSILKCNNPIALPDCATIALATKNKIPALFAKKEGELEKPLILEAFKIDIFFLEDLIP